MMSKKSFDSGWVEDEEESDPGSRSCLSFKFGKHRKHPMQQQGFKREGVQKIPVYQSTSDVASSNHNSIPIVTPPTKETLKESPIARLMTPPMPENRRQREIFDSQKRQKGIYEGEIEPEGIRGQEMTFPPTSRASPNDSISSIPIRSFGPKASNPSLGMPLRVMAPDDAPSRGDENLTSQSLQPADLGLVRLSKPVASSSRATQPSVLSDSEAPRRPPLSPTISVSRPPQFAPSLMASKASSPISNNNVIDDGDSSTSSSSLKKLRDEFLNDMEIPSDEDEHDESPSTDRPLGRSFPSTPTTPTTAATSTHSIASSSATGAGASATANVSIATAERNVHALHALAMEHVHNGDLESAVALLETVITLQSRIHGKVSPQVASAQHNLGTVHAKRAQLLTDGTVAQAHVRATALQCFQTAARTARDSLGRYHGNVAVSLVRMGFLLLQARHYQNAVIVFQEALRIRLNVFGGRHLLVANLYNNLGVCHMHMGDFEKGKEYLVAALDLQREMSSESIHQLELADTLFNIGGLCLEWIRRQGPDSRRAIEAEDAFAEAYQVFTSREYLCVFVHVRWIVLFLHCHRWTF